MMNQVFAFFNGQLHSSKPSPLGLPLWSHNLLRNEGRFLMQSNNPLEVNLLIVVISQEGGFVRAAKKLGIAQASLSRRVSSLEKNIGVKLFERTSHGVELTKAGRLFVSESTISIEHAERAWDLARYQAQIENGPYRIGYSPYTHSAWLLLLNELRPLLGPPGDQPSGITLETAATGELVERVLRGRLHAALGIRPIVDEDLWVRPLGHEGFSLCVPKGHALSRKSEVTVLDLNGEMIFWLPQSKHPGFYRRITKYIRSLGVQPIFKEVRAMTHALEFVAHGFGLALLPRSAARVSHTGVAFKPLADRYLTIETALFMRRDQRYGPLKDFIDDLCTRLVSIRTNIN
jgi:LysR family transcriptional regulator, benzoate and cis,cis-muconate-responsive activator of ben and cat genes